MNATDLHQYTLVKGIISQGRHSARNLFLIPSVFCFVCFFCILILVNVAATVQEPYLAIQISQGIIIPANIYQSIAIAFFGCGLILMIVGAICQIPYSIRLKELESWKIDMQSNKVNSIESYKWIRCYWGYTL